MRALRLFGKLSLYYAVLALALLAAFSIFPSARHYLPVGGARTLITMADEAPAGTASSGANAFTKSEVIEQARDRTPVQTFGQSLFWLITAILGALIVTLPVSWVYMEIRAPDEYDQSLIGTIIMLPIVVTSIVVVVQNSLALAFSLAGIAGAVRFRNSLKSSGDALFILLSVGIGLSAGIGAVELAIVMSVAFNYCFLALWLSEYGERRMMKRYMSDFDPNDPESVNAVAPPPDEKEKKAEKPAAAAPAPAPGSAGSGA
jgi:hypothetical protein